ncbi:hypothetical protein MNBD_IGNAVI01-110, partial [hydrothermal vent metagenome]
MIDKKDNCNSSELLGLKKSIFSFSKLFIVVCLLFISLSTVYAQDDNIFQFKSNTFIIDWLVCGPFPNKGSNNINTDFLFEHGGETGINPSPSLEHSSSSVPSGKVTWKKIKADDSGKLDFRANYFPNDKNVAYAAAIIECDKKTPALLKTGSNDRLKVWLNGKLVHYYPEPRASGPDADLTPVLLNKGKNLLLAKVDQEGGNWWLYARFEKLISVDDRIFILKPVVSPISKKVSETTMSDIFTVLAFNATDAPVGPVYFDVLQNDERKKGHSVYPSIEPGQTVRMTADSEIEISKLKDTITADVKISTVKGEKTLNIKGKRITLPNYEDFQIYIVPHSHADLSWPATPEVSTNLNVKAIQESINILADLPDFKFSEEDVFVLREFLRRYPERFEEVKSLLHKNILECGGFYLGPSETLLGGEGLIRNLYFGKLWLKNTFGLNTEMAWNVDEPGHTLQMPQILSKAGIKNFIIWKVLMRYENNLNVTGYVGPAIFKWQSPDGSTVMVTHSPEGYGTGARLRRDFYDAEPKMHQFIESEAAEIIKWKLPPVVLMADGSDVSIPDARVAVNAKLWNEKYGAPKLKIASTVEYFEAVDKALQKGEGEVQTITGELPSWWDGTQSVENDAFMLTRHAEYFLTTAEKFAAINDVLFSDYDYPRLAINNAWKGKLWVHEHNWGGKDGDISDAIKLARARATFRQSNDIVTSTLDTLVSNIRFRDSGIPLVIFNSLTWKRTDIVDHVIVLKKQGVLNLHLLDSSGKEVPVQIEVQAVNPDGSISRAEIIFEAQAPALGYATYYLVPGKNKTKTSLFASVNTLENRFFKVKIDDQTGGIRSIFDKMNNSEILDTSKYQGNELVALENFGVDEAEEFTDKWWRMSEKPASVTLVESGPVRAKILVKGSIMESGRNQEITLYASLPRIDMKTELTWDGSRAIQINAVFPFKLKQPRLTYEVPFGMVEYGKENPNSMAAHPTIRGTNNWIDLSNDKMGVTLATEVTPFDTKDRLDPRFHDARIIKGRLPNVQFSMFDDGSQSYKTYERINMRDPMLLQTDFVIQPILLRSVFSCGDQNLFFTQEGMHPYRFSISTHKNALVPHNAAKFGWEHNTPFIVRRGEKKNGKLPDTQSFIEVSEPNVLVSILKKSEDGKGIVLRCYETDGKDTDVTITFFKSLTSAIHTNIIEENEEEVKLENGK